MAWTQEEIAEMAIADAEIEEDFCMTREEMREACERDDYVLDGQLTFRELARKRYNQEYNRRYYAAHKDALKGAMAKRYVAHRDEERERYRRWREDNAEYCKDYQAAYYNENRAEILAKKQSAYEVNRAYRKIMEGLNGNIS